MNILLIDDHAVVREGLKQILSVLDVTFGEAASGPEALYYVQAQPWNLVMLELALPGRDGLEVLIEIKLRRPKLPVIVFSVYPEDQYGWRALKVGAACYLAKHSSPEEIVAAARHALDGRRFISPALGLHLAERIVRPSDEAELTNRELQILRLIGAGQTVGEIARLLALSPKTVSTHRTRVVEKLGLRTNAELALYAIRNNLIS